MPVDRGKFITLEGGEGVGKTTNLAFVNKYLVDNNINVVVTREPGGTELAEKIRTLLLTKEQEVLTDHAELLLVFAARAQHIHRVIIPALTNGDWVLCDRFTDATYAYQGSGRGMKTDTIAWLENFIQGQFRPDLTLLLDAPEKIGLARAKSRNQQADRFESEQIEFFTKVRNGYLQRAASNPGRIKVVDAEQSLDKVQDQLKQYLDTLLCE
jgi:dTMP kinase